MRVVLVLSDEDGPGRGFALAFTLNERWLEKPVSMLVATFAARLHSKLSCPPAAVGELTIATEGGEEVPSSVTIKSALRDGARLVVRRGVVDLRVSGAKEAAAELLSRFNADAAASGAKSAAQAEAFLRNGQPEAALKVVDAALVTCFSRRAAPACRDGAELCLSLLFSRAVALAAVGCSTQAEAAYRTTLQVCAAGDPRRRTVSHNLVLLLATSGDSKAAVAAAHDTAKEFDDADSWYEYATVAVAAGRREASICGYEAALAADPGHVPSVVSLVSNLEKDPLKGPEAAAAVARRAISHGVVWSTPLQRPQFWFPGLAAKPWWDANDFWFSSLLRRHFTDIRTEWEAQHSSGSEVGDRAGFTHDGMLKLSGSWREHVFFSNGARLEETARRFPKTAALVDSIHEAVDAARVGLGEVLFSTLAPGTLLRPHCGSSNARLTLHFGVVVPDGDLSIRCGSDRRRWLEGDSIIFDDSFEHEVCHRACAPRTVLLVNFWHPQVPRDLRTDAAWRRRAHHGALLESYCHGTS